MIKYLVTSKICWKMSSMLQQWINDHKRTNMLDFEAQNRSLVIVTERKEDPITPLIFNWTYQDMLCEILGMSQNRIKLKEKGQNNNNEDNKAGNEYNLFVEEDQFYKKN